MKKEMREKILAIILTLALVVSMFPVMSVVYGAVNTEPTVQTPANKGFALSMRLRQTLLNYCISSPPLVMHHSGIKSCLCCR